MKTTIKIKTMLIGMLVAFNMSAQETSTKSSVAVLGVESKGMEYSSESLAYMVRLELEKCNNYTVIDRLDVTEVATKNNIDADKCFAKSCLLSMGQLLEVDKVMNGRVERFGEKIVIALYLIDVKTGVVEKSNVTEYLNLEKEVQKMVRISIQKMNGIEPDKNLVNLLIDYDVPFESPNSRLSLSGPRMGAAYTLGDNGERLQAPKNQGGYDMFPVTFQFGWQKEVQYLSAGNFQALIENIFMISGMESGRFIPSYTLMNGFRFGKNGWEFGFGPSFYFSRRANGYYDDDNKWHLENEWKETTIDTSGSWPVTVLAPNPHPIISRYDNRGALSLSASLILAVGRTFHSGYLNIPVNLYVSPLKEGTMVGFSFGFNVQKK